MLVSYEIVHVHPDGTEELIQSVNNIEEVTRITETPKYVGSWIRDTRKLLRWNRGELHVRTIESPMQVTSCNTTYLGSMPLYQLVVVNGDDLRLIILNAHTIVGLDVRKQPIWQTNSFTRLSDLVSKDVAYVILQYYEKYQAEFNLKGVM